MTAKADILLEGTYLYFQNDNNYSQENFKLVHLPNPESFHFYAEILSRIENGEFLKIMVRFEMNQHMVANFVRVEKSIGNKYALETYKLDTNSFELKYSFQTTQKTQEFKRTVGAKHFLTSPAFCTSAIFTQTKKIDSVGRTPVSLMTSKNDWTYEGPPEEKTLYAEFKTRDFSEMKLNGNNLSAQHLCLYQFDSNHTPPEAPVDIYLSKHFGVPYQMNYGDQKIVIKNLKKLSL
jgi:hypothetical protein